MAEADFHLPNCNALYRVVLNLAQNHLTAN
jgi:hypothetical protein